MSATGQKEWTHGIMGGLFRLLYKKDPSIGDNQSSIIAAYSKIENYESTKQNCVFIYS